MAYRLVPWHTRSGGTCGTLRKEMDHLLERFMGADSGGTASQFFAPETNLAETDEGYEITVDLPGLKSEDFNLEFSDGQLWITGERQQEKEEKGKTYHRVERSYGQFRRGISLGTDVDAEKIGATYKDGVLTVLVPKAEAVLPRKIEVKG